MELEYSTMSSEGSSVESELSQESTYLEEFHIEGVRLQLPQGLCENKSIFKEFFSHRTWHECFTEQQKQHLKVNNRGSISKKILYFSFAILTLTFSNIGFTKLKCKQTRSEFVRFEVLLFVLINMSVFWVMTL